MINSVQQALAANLDMQAMYELVGDKIRDIFDAQVADIGIYDLDAGVVHYPYSIERGVRFPDEPSAHRRFQQRVVLEDRQPILVNEDCHGLVGRPAASRRRSSRATGRIGPVRPAHRGRRGARPDLPPERRPRGRVLGLGPSAPEHARRRAWRWPSRTRASSTRRSASWQRPMSAPPSSRSSTASSAAWPRTSTCSRCTSSSARRSARSSTPRSSPSRCTTTMPAPCGLRTRSSAACASRAGRSTDRCPESPNG